MKKVTGIIHVIDTLCEGTMGSLFKSQGTSETSDDGNRHGGRSDYHL